VDSKGSTEHTVVKEPVQSGGKGSVVFQDLVTLPTMLAVIVTVGLCLWFRVPGVWTLGIAAAEYVAIPAALIIAEVRRQRRS
jgi:type IV secretory pathway TrbD component